MFQSSFSFISPWVSPLKISWHFSTPIYENYLTLIGLFSHINFPDEDCKNNNSMSSKTIWDLVYSIIRFCFYLIKMMWGIMEKIFCLSFIMTRELFHTFLLIVLSLFSHQKYFFYTDGSHFIIFFLYYWES